MISSGQSRLFREFLKPRRPIGSFSPKEYFFDANAAQLSIIRDPMYEVIQMRVGYSIYVTQVCIVINLVQVSNQGSAMVDKLLVALWHAEFQFRYGLYRSGLILLADIALEFGMTKKPRRMLEEIMPQVSGLRN
jgi:anaphase-promoting complex subunit 5